MFALLAIPLVQIHATACYVDLPANACVTVLVLIAFRHVVERKAPRARVLFGAALLASVAANMKFQLVPVVLAASAVLVFASAKRDADRRTRMLVIAAAIPFVFATPIKNTVQHGNPVWPVELHALGRTLPHTERAYASSPDWLEGTPRPLRFASSVLELGLPPIAAHRRWSIDQWTPPHEPGYRMGGFFGAYAFVNIVGIAVAAVRRRSREARCAAAFMISATAIASVLPQSHELRYYMYWMMLLVCLNLVLWSRERPATTAIGAVVAFAIVTWSTSATYVWASGDSFASLVAAKTDASQLEGVKPGERVCVRKEPWSFLYASAFHRGAAYSVQEAEDDDDCRGARTIE